MGRHVLLWLRRDLRLADQPALRAAADATSLTPVYVHAPHEEGPAAPGAAGRWWLHHALAALEGELGRRHSGLLYRRGDSATELRDLARACGATEVLYCRRYEPPVAARDAAVERELRAAGLEVHSFADGVLFEPGSVRTQQDRPYRVYTPFWRACRERGLDASPDPAPRRLPPLPAGATGCNLADLGLLPSVRWDGGLQDCWTPGPAAALARLEAFADCGLDDYAAARDQPAADGTSRLSPHLHFGELSPRQVLAAVLGRGETDASARFRQELGWREFSRHLLHAFPELATRPLDRRFERFDWRDDRDDLAAWQQGRTGIPLVDAGMRELWKTGWMHNRVRMVCASLLTKNLRLPWQWGERWFWDTLVDADLANNVQNWQWVAGCGADAAPYFRVFNPVRQGERFDPDGAYLRRWAPEYAERPPRHVHRPADPAAQALPAPICDLAASRRDALEAFGRIGR